MKKKNTNIIKCAFCGWKKMKWRRSKKGKAISGYPQLIYHVMIEHPEEYEKVEAGEAWMGYYTDTETENLL
jgi:hypothetical protein